MGAIRRVPGEGICRDTGFQDGDHDAGSDGVVQTLARIGTRSNCG